MSLKTILKERETRRRTLREDALKEVERLVALLKERYRFDSIYICGSILCDRFGTHSDIDLIIGGMKTEDFFKAYALLIKESRYKIDLKPFEDLTEDFQKQVLTRGVKIG